MADETPPLLSDQEWTAIVWRFNHDDPRVYDQLRADGRVLLAEISRLNKMAIERESELKRLRAQHNEAWDLIDRLSEDLADHEPIAHDWLLNDANAWRAKHPKTK